MKKAKTFIIPMLALAAFGLVACGGGQSSSQQSSSAPHASIDVDTIASVEITNKVLCGAAAERTAGVDVADEHPS